MPENETVREEGRRLTEPPKGDEPALPPPPDGGYGWVIVFASFMCNLVVDGIGYSFNVFLDVLVQDFHSNKSSVAWVNSVLAGTLLIAGPLVSALCNKFGCRAVCIAGAVVGGAGILLSTYSTSVPVMIFTYGLIGGIGLGMIYLPSIVAVGYYFDTKRSLATGIAVCGSGAGACSFGPMAALMMQKLGSWQSANRVIAGIVCGCSLWGFLMKPLTFPDEPNDKPERSGDKMQKLELIDENVDNKKSQGENGSAGGVGAAARLARNVSTPAFSAGAPGMHKRGSVPALDQRKQSYGDNLQRPDILMHGSDPALYKHCKQSIEFGAVYNSKLSVSKEAPKMVKPLSRKDIFYSGSVLNLPQYQSQKSLHAFRKSMASLPQSVADAENQDAGKCCACLPDSVRSALASMMDVSLLKDPVFMLIGVSNFFGMAGLYMPFVYLNNAAQDQGVDRSNAELLVPIIGATNIIARITFGYIADFPWMDSLLLNNVCLGIATLAVGLTPFCGSFASFISVAIVFGIAIAGYISLTSIILVDLLGLDKLTNAFGLLILFRGVAAIIGSPIAGAAYDATKKYDLSFYIGGVFFLLSLLSSVAAGFLRKKPSVEPQPGALAPIDEDQEEDEVGAGAVARAGRAREGGYSSVPQGESVM